MPTYRSISLQLHSQFDVETFPEYLPKPHGHYTERGISSPVPTHVDEKASTCSVYVAVFPGSTFWLSYSVAPPVPEDQHFLFKLFINDAHIVSWSTGKGDGWKGKTMFGLFERNEEDGGEKRLEKRALRFTAPNRDGVWQDVTNAFDEDAKMEIRVYRAGGRKRIGWEAERYTETPHGTRPRGIDLVNAGRVGGSHPKKFYKFALIDPTDRPFATIRYYYRTWEQILYLELIDEEINDSDMSVIEPYWSDVLDLEEKAEESGMATVEDSKDAFDVEKDNAATCTQTYIPTGAPGTEACSSDESSDGQCSQRRAVNPPQFYQLSVPPALKLELSHQSSRPLPTDPQKSDLDLSTAYRPHPAYAVEEGTTSTPSPIKSIRDIISTAPLGRKKAFVPSSLMNVVASVWNRHGLPGSKVSSGRNSRSSSRNIC